MFNATLIIIVTTGLILFTVLLYVSRRTKKHFKRRRSRIIEDWKERL